GGAGALFGRERGEGEGVGRPADRQRAPALGVRRGGVSAVARERRREGVAGAEGAEGWQGPGSRGAGGEAGSGGVPPAAQGRGVRPEAVIRVLTAGGLFSVPGRRGERASGGRF